MKLINGLLDYSKPWIAPDIYLFTGNPVVKNNGAIVMGRGAAKQVRDTYPGIDKSFATVIEARPNNVINWVSLPNEQHLGWFKVKDHWRSNASIELIKASAKRLKEIALEHPDLTFHMNYPGIGNGKLELNDIQPILNTLPDNVLIYK